MEKIQKPPSPLRDYWNLTKPGITRLCVFMTAGGYWLAVKGSVNWFHFATVLLGTMLVVSGSAAWNMYSERVSDRQMKRTANRPLPTGRISAQNGLFLAIVLSIAGVLILALYVNLLTAGLALLAHVTYVFIYTPLKRKTPEFLLIGTIPGAMPALLGWTAVTNQIQLPGIILFAILIFWQLPHFMALSLMAQSDYAKTDILTTPKVFGAEKTRYLAFYYTLPLLPISLMLVPLREAGLIYLVTALLLGIWFAWVAAKGVFYKEVPERWPYKLFYASLLYLPLLTLGMIIDHVLPL